MAQFEVCSLSIAKPVMMPNLRTQNLSLLLPARFGGDSCNVRVRDTMVCERNICANGRVAQFEVGSASTAAIDTVLALGTQKALIFLSVRSEGDSNNVCAGDLEARLTRMFLEDGGGTARHGAVLRGLPLCGLSHNNNTPASSRL